MNIPEMIIWVRWVTVLTIILCLMSIHLRIRWHEHIYHKEKEDD